MQGAGSGLKGKTAIIAPRHDLKTLRLSAIAIAALAFVLAAGASYVAARITATVVEKRSVMAVRGVLADDGLTWASVLGDGLMVILEGRAPTEVERFRAISQAGGVVDASRVIDNLSVQEAVGITPPDRKSVV